MEVENEIPPKERTITNIKLNIKQCRSARDIQSAIDSLKESGGKIVLPELDLTLDRGLELYSGITIEGQKEKTILRKGPSRKYPLLSYHNYGMFDVPLENTDGLEVGMTVSINDNKRGGFYGTFARITWIENNWVGLDTGIHADYIPTEDPCLTTSFSMIYAHNQRAVAIKNLYLDGDLQNNPDPMNGCRGSSIYFFRCRNMTVENVVEKYFNGEGMGFQACADVRISNSEFSNNSGNGMHPGAGSTGVVFEHCVGKNNGASGFFFCVRATRVDVSDCTFINNNDHGISIGARDCHNHIKNCIIENNEKHGVFFRLSPMNTEVHSVRVSDCRIKNNKGSQLYFSAHSHDIIIERCEVVADDKARRFSFEDNNSAIYLSDLNIASTELPVHPAVVNTAPDFKCGNKVLNDKDIRHLNMKVV